MKKIILSAASGLAMMAATPALAADVQQDAVETVEIEMSEERRALALAAVDAYWPQGNSKAIVDHMTGPFVDEMLYTPIGTLVERYGLMDAMGEIFEMVGAMEDMEAAMAGEEVETDETDKGGLDVAPEKMIEGMLVMFGDQRLIDFIASEDEHIDERIAIIRDVLREELPPIFAKAEPRMRTAFAEMFARRFDDQDLAALAAFADTPAGQKYAKELWLMSFDPSYFKGMIAAAPAYVEGLPRVVETMEARMAHLPPMGGEDEDAAACEGDDEDCEAEAPSAEELIAEAEELEAYAAELMEQAAELRAQAAAL